MNGFRNEHCILLSGRKYARRPGHRVLEILFTYLAVFLRQGWSIPSLLHCLLSNRRCARMSWHNESQNLEKFTWYLFSQDGIQDQFKIVRVLKKDSVRLQETSWGWVSWLEKKTWFVDLKCSLFVLIKPNFSNKNMHKIGITLAYEQSSKSGQVD